MQLSQVPTKIPLAWGSSAGGPYINPIPTPSQIGITPGRASFTDGFVPLNFQPLAAGGVPPFGEDFNGITNQITAGLQWLQAFGIMRFDAAFSTIIGGYPLGAIVQSATTLGLLWQCLVDNNPTNPDTGGANWAPLFQRTLTQNIDYYVATTGNDANNGTTAGTPWQTLPHAGTVISKINTNGFQITVHVAAGTYSLGFSIPSIFGGGSVALVATNGTPANTIISTTNGPAITLLGSGILSLNGFRLAAGGGTGPVRNGILTAGGGNVIFINMDFDICADGQMMATGGSTISLATALGSYSVVGGGSCHAGANTGGQTNIDSANITFFNAPAYTVGFAFANNAGHIEGVVNSFAGTFASVTGPRYLATNGGSIYVGGAGVNWFPGNSAGSSATGYYT